MKKQLFSLTLLSALISWSALAAGPVANIQVTGDIKPPTCTVNAGDNDILFDYGRISPSLIPQSTNYQLPIIASTLEVVCDAQTFLTFIPTDNYTINSVETSIQDEVFGLVDASDTTKEVGRVGYVIKDLYVDNEPAYLGRSGTRTSTAAWWSDSLIRNAIIGWTSLEQKNVADPSELQLVAGKKFTATLSTGNHTTAGGVHATAILSKDSLIEQNIDITNGLDYLGQVILTFNFGI